MSENGTSEWGIFYQTLNRLGPRLLEGVHPDLEEWISFQAADTDQFWSAGLHANFDLWAEGDRTNAVKNAFEDWVHNVKQHLYDILGPDTLIPFKKYRINRSKRSQWIAAIDNIRLRLDGKHLSMFIDSVLLDYAESRNSPMLLLQGVVAPYA